MNGPRRPSTWLDENDGNDRSSFSRLFDERDCLLCGDQDEIILTSIVTPRRIRRLSACPGMGSIHGFHVASKASAPLSPVADPFIARLDHHASASLGACAAGARCGIDSGFRLEGLPASLLPYRQRLFAIFAAELLGDGKEGAVERGAIVGGEFDEPSLDDEAAQFDQMTRACAPFERPVAHVGSRL
jgi:hypothetical protein